MRGERMYRRILRQIIPPIFYNKPYLAKIKSSVLLTLFYRLFTKKSRMQFHRNELKRQINELPEIDKLFSEKKMKEHYIYEPVRNTLKHPDLYITQIRYYRMYNFFKRHYPEIFEPDTKILNVGDTDGILLEALGRKGTSLNMNKECVEFIRNKGINAVLANAESLGFEGSSFDFVFCFQTLEHCPNPIKVLNELGKVTRKKVFLSIPQANETKVYNIRFWVDLKKTSWKETNVKNVDCHIFEFSTVDFKNILSYTNLEYETNFPINYFDDNSFKKKLLNKHNSYFNFFVLKPVEYKKEY